MPAPIVFFDIAGPDTEALQRFYRLVFDWDFTTAGQFHATVTSPLPSAIRMDLAEQRVYLGVDDVAAKLADIVAHGGAIDSPRFEVPGVVVLGLFRDPAGNPMGLVEMQDGKPKIP